MKNGGYVYIISGYPTITERGICYSKYTNYPTYSSNVEYCGSGSGDFNAYIYLYDDYSTYYYRAFAIYDDTIVYGDVYSVTTGSKTGNY